MLTNRTDRSYNNNNNNNNKALFQAHIWPIKYIFSSTCIYEERLKECALTTLEMRRLREGQIEVFKILNGYETID